MENAGDDQLDEDKVSRILEQWEIDDINQAEINEAQRNYRKCVSGKCPVVKEKRNKFEKKTEKQRTSKKLKNFTNTKRIDKILAIEWKDKGRDHRFEILEEELKELDIKLNVVRGFPHVHDHESDFQSIERLIKFQETFQVEIQKIQTEVVHLKSQFNRLNKKENDLAKETESENQYNIHIRKAIHQLEIYEGKVQVSREQECFLNTENLKLRMLMKDMLCDRAVFNSYWQKVVKKLSNRRKFLLDMIERSNQAFSQGAEFLDNYKKLQSRATQDKELHINEMIKMERQIDANEIMNLFLGGKGSKRNMFPLESREVRRRNDFKEEYSDRLNMYHSIIEKIKEFTGHDDINKSVAHYLKSENEGFQNYNYLNEMNYQIEYLAHNYDKLSTNIVASQDYNERKLKYFNQSIDDLNKKLLEEINVTLKHKDEKEKYDRELQKYFDTIFEILKILNCNLKPVEKLLGDQKNITIYNMKEFLSLLEDRTNEVISFVYCDQRKNVGLATDDNKLVVKSMKRTPEDPIKIENIITTQQCAECAEGEDVNRYDEKIVYPLDRATIVEMVRQKVEAPEIAYRLHNLSKCCLPRSGVVAGRRYAE